MKKYILIIIPVLFFIQCNKDKSDFEIIYNTNFNIMPGISFLTTENIAVEIPNFNIQQRLAVEGYTPDEIARIDARSLRFDIISGGDFAFLDRARMMIRTDDLPEIEIGYLEPVPDNIGSSLDLIPSITDVTEYVKSDIFTVVFKMDAKYSTSQILNVRVYLSFNAFAEGE